VQLKVIKQYDGLETIKKYFHLPASFDLSINDYVYRKNKLAIRMEYSIATNKITICSV